MALHWDLTQVKDQSVCWVEAQEDIPEMDITKGDQYMSSTTNHLIWMTMAVGIGELDDKTAPEFYARLKMLSLLDGHKNEITVQDIQNHIGLKCNVAYESKSKWLRRTTERDYNRFMDQFDKEVAVNG